MSDDGDNPLLLDIEYFKHGIWPRLSIALGEMFVE